MESTIRQINKAENPFMPLKTRSNRGLANEERRGTPVQPEHRRCRNRDLKYVVHGLGRDVLPTLPTLPLVFRILVLPSVLFPRVPARTFPTLMPLPTLAVGVFGRPLIVAGAVFSVSLPSPKPYDVCVTDV